MVILKPSAMDQWLVRTAQNQISGPFPKEQVCQMVQEGRLNLDDEICPANGYWIYLHEREEVARQLGIEVPRVAAVHEEDVTETQTETLTEVSAARAADLGEAHPESAPRESLQDVLPEIEQTLEEVEHTGILTNRAFRGIVEKKKTTPNRPVEFQVTGVTSGTVRSSNGLSTRGLSLETSSIWRIFAWLLAIGVVAVAIVVVRLMQSH